MVDNAIKRIKIKHFPALPDENVELHAKDMENNYGVFNGINHPKILDIFSDISGYIGNSSTPLTPFSVIIQKHRLVKRDLDLELWGHRLLFERMNKYVIRKNDQYIASKSPPQYGILIEDTEGPNKDARLRNKVRDMFSNGTMYDHIDYLIEDPLFTDSKWLNLSQVVDCVAYCVRRNYMINQNPIKKVTWESYFNQIYDKFDKPNGRTTPIGSGIKIFPST